MMVQGCHPSVMSPTSAQVRGDIGKQSYIFGSGFVGEFLHNNPIATGDMSEPGITKESKMENHQLLGITTYIHTICLTHIEIILFMLYAVAITMITY